MKSGRWGGGGGWGRKIKARERVNTYKHAHLFLYNLKWTETHSRTESEQQAGAGLSPWMLRAISGGCFRSSVFFMCLLSAHIYLAAAQGGQRSIFNALFQQMHSFFCAFVHSFPSPLKGPAKRLTAENNTCGIWSGVWQRHQNRKSCFIRVMKGKMKLQYNSIVMKSN